MDKPIVSIIVPIYNSGQFLDKCIDSILAQSIQNIEVLLVDDGSTDESGIIADGFALKDKRVIVYHIPNNGVSNARNLGLIHSRGEWVTFVDSDDTIHKSYLESLLNLASPETDYCYCNFEMITEDSHYLYTTFAPGKTKEDTLRNLFLSGWMFCIGVLFRKSFLETNKLVFPTHINYTEDVWFMARIIFYANTASKTDLALYNYNRTNSNSITHKSFNEKAESIRLLSMMEIIKFLQSNNVFDGCKDACYWRLLVWKSRIIYFPEKYATFNASVPEANHYIWNNPYLSYKIKLLLWLLAHNLFPAARIIMHLYRVKNKTV